LGGHAYRQSPGREGQTTRTYPILGFRVTLFLRYKGAGCGTDRDITNRDVKDRYLEDRDIEKIAALKIAALMIVWTWGKSLEAEDPPPPDSFCLPEEDVKRVLEVA
jgi:hypothetical protein